MKRIYLVLSFALAALFLSMPCLAQQGSVNQYISDGAPDGETRDPYTVNSVETGADRSLSAGTGLSSDVTAAIIIGAVTVLVTIAVIATALVLKRRGENF